MKRIQHQDIFRIEKKTPKTSWWVPVWKGLVFDSASKHRLKMGTSIWLYLYLLFSVNRRNASVTKKQMDMARDIGMTVRTIQNHLLRLKKNGYIITENTRPQRIKITKWKLFHIFNSRN